MSSNSKQTLEKVGARDAGRLLSEELERLAFEVGEWSQRLQKSIQVEDVHELRTRLRRLRSMLWILRHGSKVRVGAKLREELRRWSRALGERRDCDVLIHDAGRFEIESDAIRVRRVDANAKLRYVITEKSRERVLKKLARLREELDRHPQVHRKRVLRRALERYFPVVEKWPRDPQRLHRIRIGSKKMRYVLEAFGHKLPGLHELQSNLGRVHDLELLKEQVSLGKFDGN